MKALRFGLIIHYQLLLVVLAIHFFIPEPIQKAVYLAILLFYMLMFPVLVADIVEIWNSEKKEQT